MIRKILALIVVSVAITILISACSRKKPPLQEGSDLQEKSSSQANNAMADETASTLTSTMTELTNGFSAVRFEGEDGFEDFLATGGGASDAVMFLSSFAIGITNPTAILTVLFAFTYVGVSDANGFFEGILLVLGVFVGTYIWWFALSVITCATKNKTQSHRFRHMNRLFSAILTLLGTGLCVRGII